MIIFLLFLLTVSQNIELKREILKKGFHRELITSIKFEKSVKNCNVFIHEKFSKSIYLSINEIEDKRRYNERNNLQMLNFEYHNKTFDIEKPSFQSQKQDVTISTKVQEDFIQITIPFHFRYQKPSKILLYRNVTIHDPVSITLKCKDRIESLKWKPLAPIIEQIPCGNLNDLEIVKYLTILITFFSSILIMINSF